MALSLGCLVTSIISLHGGKKVRGWVLSLSNLRLPSLHGDLSYSSPGTLSSVLFLNWTTYDPNGFRPPLWVNRSLTLPSASNLATTLRRKVEDNYFSLRLCVHVKDNSNLQHGKFHGCLFPYFSSKFSDLNFASYVLYNYQCNVYVTHRVSLGDLCTNSPVSWFFTPKAIFTTNPIIPEHIPPKPIHIITLNLLLEMTRSRSRRTAKCKWRKTVAKIADTPAQLAAL